MYWAFGDKESQQFVLAAGHASLYSISSAEFRSIRNVISQKSVNASL